MPGPMVLDEVQRVPDLLLAVKRAVDRVRQPGRYILTGSANLLLMRSVSESLAGRAAYLSLWPMTRRERSGQGQAGIWSELLDHPCEEWPEVLDDPDAEPADWRRLAAEVDFVVERGPHLLGIEIKATTRRRALDARHLMTFRDEYGDSVRGCLMLHAGGQVEWLGPRILAAPWWRLV